MFDDDEDDDHNIDLYYAPLDTRVFADQGKIIFPSKNKIITIDNKDTKVSIFFEKRKLTNGKLIYIDNMYIDYINNYVFIFCFNGKEYGGASAASSMLDEGRAKLFNTFEEAEKAFSKLHYKLDKLENHKLIYHGARNEG